MLNLNLETQSLTPCHRKFKIIQKDSEMTADLVFKNDHRSDIVFDNEE